MRNVTSGLRTPTALGLGFDSDADELRSRTL
jgi:hypothetical protein